MEKRNCPVCEKGDAEFEQRGREDVYLWECRRCGRFEQGDAARFVDLTKEDRWRLSHEIRCWSDEHPKGYRTGFQTTEGLREVLSTVDPTPLPSELRRRLVIAVGERTKTLGGWTTTEAADVWVARVGSAFPEHLAALLLQLERDGLIRTNGAVQAGFKDGCEFGFFRQAIQLSLSLTGWTEYEKLQTHRAVSTTVFVALSERGSEARWAEGIKPAIEACGFLADRVALPGQDGHQPITDQIISRIRRARFLIADLTGERPNVYWEAGFAMGLGIPVIFCCTNIEKDAHFNTQQYYHIEESDPTKLKEALIARIQALGLDRNPPS